ncbi:hypothetical protein AAZX31_14G149500 [Glycine max]
MQHTLTLILTLTFPLSVSLAHVVPHNSSFHSSLTLALGPSLLLFSQFTHTRSRCRFVQHSSQWCELRNAQSHHISKFHRGESHNLSLPFLRLNSE